MKKYIVLTAAVITLALILAIGQQSEQPPPPPTAHPVLSDDNSANKMEFNDVATPADGITIADLYAQKNTLSGKEVIVSGKVVKFTPNVMGTNWVHLRDGTGNEGTNDLTVNTNSVVKIGDIITIRGMVTLDKDLGSGYKYDILIENAEVTAE